MVVERTVCTLREVAAEAGVSAGTVSRVLRGYDKVLPATREHVLRVAERLRYRPNQLMRGVRNGRSQSIGVMVPVTDPFGAQIVSGIHDVLSEADYAPILLWSHWLQPEEERMIHQLVERRVDGVILRPVDHGVPDDYFREVWERRIPLVSVDTDLGWTHCDFVGTDDERGARLATEHLLALGHRHIAHLGGPAGALNSQLRVSGFRQAIGAHIGATCTTAACALFDRGRAEALALLRATPRPTAIFAATDFLAQDVYAAAHELTLRIPEDLSVVGYADLAFATWLKPSLTTVRQDAYEIGRRAAALVLDRARGANQDHLPRKIRLDPELMVRGSTGEVPAN